MNSYVPLKQNVLNSSQKYSNMIIMHMKSANLIPIDVYLWG